LGADRDRVKTLPYSLSSGGGEGELVLMGTNLVGWRGTMYRGDERKREKEEEVGLFDTGG